MWFYHQYGQRKYRSYGNHQWHDEDQILYLKIIKINVR